MNWTNIFKLHAIWTLAAHAADLPIVDLGYEMHQANLFNTTGDYFAFSDIRFAAPPVGNLRFAKPQPPSVDRSSIQQGGQRYSCLQAAPSWTDSVGDVLDGIPGGRMFLEAMAAHDNIAAKETETEDCLFLDVVVPRSVFECKGNGAPVMVWIYGGGFTSGSKTASGNPAGLIKSSQADGSDGMIFVAINYRLGAFGFLSGISLDEAGGIPNAGLYDQRMALEWVQTNIAKFGGDPKRVTVVGESAGGSSIMYQMAAFGGTKEPAPFTQAIPQSAGMIPNVSPNAQEATLQRFLAHLNVSCVQEARKLSTASLQAANRAVIDESVYGTFTFGPVVDGEFAPGLLPQLLREGRFDKAVSVMVGQNSNEGLYFAPKAAASEAGFQQHVLNTLPTLRGLDATADEIVHNMYSARTAADASNASLADGITRAAVFNSDAFINVNRLALHKALNNSVYDYLFAVSPGLHGQDVAYTFFNELSPAINTTVALMLQRYITRFVASGSPNGPDLPNFPPYGSNKSVLALGSASVGPMTDPSATARAEWWLKGLFY